MNFDDIYTKLAKCGTEQNRKAYQRYGAKGDLFGVSLDDLKKLKTEVVSPEGEKGINHSIAQNLWKTRNVDARIFACMIAEPSKITRNEANRWITFVNYYVLADYFAELIAQTRFGQDIMYLWIQSQNEYVKRVGFNILSYYAKNDQSKSELFFNAFLQKIKQEIQFAPNRAKEAMNDSLIAIGGRSESLRDKVLIVAESIGSIKINQDDTSYKTIDIKESLKKT